MTIREYLKSLGAKDSELSANVVSLMERHMMIDADLSQFEMDTVATIIKNASDGLNNATKYAESNIHNAKAVLHRLEDAIGAAQIEKQDLINQTSRLGEMKIRNADVKDAVLAYSEVLKATKGIFGESMSAEVMCKAIEAGSYIAYRGIMGPKTIEDRRQKF